jgi:membrane-bound lytic murein transglycosylase B
MSIADWRALGVVPAGRSLPDAETAALLEPEGSGETPYLLTGNYRAILGYNCSNFYAMSVALLSDAIARR